MSRGTFLQHRQLVKNNILFELFVLGLFACNSIRLHAKFIIHDKQHFTLLNIFIQIHALQMKFKKNMREQHTGNYYSI